MFKWEVVVMNLLLLATKYPPAMGKHFKSTSVFKVLFISSTISIIVWKTQGEWNRKCVKSLIKEIIWLQGFR